MRVDELAPAPGSTHPKKRVGRGIGGKGGKTAGRGTKGQQSRGRGKVARGFEGGQMPLKQRVPKLKGFNNPFRVEYQAVNLDSLTEIDEPVVNPEILQSLLFLCRTRFVLRPRATSSPTADIGLTDYRTEIEPEEPTCCQT